MNWTNVLGLRYDEAQRVVRSRDNRDRWENATPLFDARVTNGDVAAFWTRQPFDLALPNIKGRTPHGNCDLCFLKSARTISALLAEDPARADWRVAMETLSRVGPPSGSRFRIDRPGYEALRNAVLRQQEFDFGDQDALAECFCHE